MRTANASSGPAATSSSAPAAGSGGRAVGWGASLRWQGRTVADRRIHGPVIVGEDPACSFVVHGLGPAVTVATGDGLLGLPDREGRVFTAGDPDGLALTAARTLAPGERAELRLSDEITLELRREHYDSLPLATLLDVRYLARQLVLGALAVAAVALLVRIEAPTNTLELRGDPEAEADPDSALVRAMFVAAAVAPPMPVTRELFTFAAPPAPPPPPPSPAPMPILAEAEVAVPVPLAEVDAPAPDEPRRRRKPRSEPVVDMVEQTAILGVLDHDSDVLAMLSSDADVLDRVEGGVVGGVIGRVGVVGGVLGGVEGGVVDHQPVATVTNIPVGQGTLRIDEPYVPHVEVPAPVEADMGPGSGHDEPTAPPVHPAPSGPNSHTADGAEFIRGDGGLAAVAPLDRCDDPTLVRKSQVDVVFVVDVSTTMTFMLDRIEKQIAQVDAEARAQALDPRYGLVVFVDDVLVANAGKAYPDIAALQTDLAKWQAFTATNRQIHSTAHNLDWPENTLDAVHAAATSFDWRPADTTLRMIVHATDDDFGEAPAVQSQQTVQHTYAETVDALRAAEVRMFSFAARVGGQCECLDVRAGLYTRHNGRPSLPESTGGAVFDIDDVAAGKLAFSSAVAGAVRSAACTRYPLLPAAARRQPAARLEVDPAFGSGE